MAFGLKVSLGHGVRLKVRFRVSIGVWGGDGVGVRLRVSLRVGIGFKVRI